VVDFVQGIDRAEANELDVLAFFAKLIDVQPASGIFVALPRLSSEAKSLAEANRVRYLEVSRLGEVAPALDKLVEAL
jgi:hypothetical protein